MSRRFLLGLEFAALFVAFPLVLWQAALRATTRVPVLPVLWLAAAVATVWLARKRGWTRRKFFGLDGVARDDWLRLGVRAAVGAFTLAAVLSWLAPSSELFTFPRCHPHRWLVVMVAYPLLSVLPQGIIYRALFFERYAPLFGRFAPAAAVAVFYLAHIVFNNPYALALTLAGGLIFTMQYRRTGSLMFANLEHALFGNLAFSIGWGMYLHGGTMVLRGGN